MSLIRDVRTERGWSIENLAHRIGGITRKGIAAFELGDRYPNRKMVRKLGEAFGIEHFDDYFFTREDMRDIRKKQDLVVAVKRMMRRGK